jgi:hypothetical protein
MFKEGGQNYEQVSIKNIYARISYSNGSLRDYSANLHFIDHSQPALSMVAHTTGTGSDHSHPVRYESIHALLRQDG